MFAIVTRSASNVLTAGLVSRCVGVALPGLSRRSPSELKEQLLDALSSADVKCTYCFGGELENVPLPGLHVENVGRIAFPLMEEQAVKLHAVSETVVDETRCVKHDRPAAANRARFGKCVRAFNGTGLHGTGQFGSSTVAPRTRWRRRLEAKTDGWTCCLFRGRDRVPTPRTL